MSEQGRITDGVIWQPVLIIPPELAKLGGKAIERAVHLNGHDGKLVAVWSVQGGVPVLQVQYEPAAIPVCACGHHYNEHAEDIDGSWCDVCECAKWQPADEPAPGPARFPTIEEILSAAWYFVGPGAVMQFGPIVVPSLLDFPAGSVSVLTLAQVGKAKPKLEHGGLDAS